MIEPNDPKRDAKVLRHYTRHQRKQRWQRLGKRAAAVAAACLGLGASTGAMYIGSILYQDHTRLAAIVDKPPSAAIALAVPPEALVTAKQNPQNRSIWDGDAWKRDAEKYIATQLTRNASSANPPRHRRPRASGDPQ